MSNPRNTYVVEKRDYSSNPWRVIDMSNGHQVACERPYSDHPDEPHPPINGPLRANTKAEATAQILRVAWKLSKLAERQAAELERAREFVRKSRDFTHTQGDDWDDDSAAFRCVVCQSQSTEGCKSNCKRNQLLAEADELLAGGE